MWREAASATIAVEENFVIDQISTIPNHAPVTNEKVSLLNSENYAIKLDQVSA
jgi:hypothetical protein